MEDNDTVAQEVLYSPPGEGSNPPPGAVQLPSEANSSPPQLSNQANNQTISQGPHYLPTPAIAHLPPGEGSNSPPGAVQLPSEANSSPPQLLNQANNQTISQGPPPPYTGNCSPSSQGRKQFSPRSCTASLGS